MTRFKGGIKLCGPLHHMKEVSWQMRPTAVVFVGSEGSFDFGEMARLHDDPHFRVEQLKTTEELTANAGYAEILVVGPSVKLTRPAIKPESLPHLRAAYLFGPRAKITGPATRTLKERKVPLLPIYEASRAMAQHTIDLMRVTLNNLIRTVIVSRCGEWYSFPRREFRGQRVGIVGGTKTSIEVAQQLLNLGDQAPEVCYWDRNRNTALESLGASFFEDLDLLLEKSEIVTLHLEPSNDNRRLIDHSRLERMSRGLLKRHAALINVASADLVNPSHLLVALANDFFDFVAFDVFWMEGPEFSQMAEERKNPYFSIMRHPQFMLTPNLGSSGQGVTQETSQAIVDDILEKLKPY